MQYQAHLTQITNLLTSCKVVNCAPQVLIIDQLGGPANILIDTISLLLNRKVSVTLVESHSDAQRALDYYDFDLVVVGLHEKRPLQITILPHIQKEHPDLAIMAVGRNLPRLYQQYARNYGARDVLNIPERAAELKTLVQHISTRYLHHNPARLQ